MAPTINSENSTKHKTTVTLGETDLKVLNAFEKNFTNVLVEPGLEFDYIKANDGVVETRFDFDYIEAHLAKEDVDGSANEQPVVVDSKPLSPLCTPVIPTMSKPAAIEDWRSYMASTTLRVTDLKKKFPNISEKTLKKLLVETGFDFDYIEAHLAKKDVDGSANEQPVVANSKPLSPLSTPFIPSMSKPAAIEVWKSYKASVTLRVTDLKKKFPNVSEKTLKDLLVKTEFDFDYIEAHLAKEDVDGSANDQPVVVNSKRSLSPHAVPFSPSMDSLTAKENVDPNVPSGNNAAVFEDGACNIDKCRQTEDRCDYEEYRAEAQQHADQWLKHEQKAGQAFQQNQEKLAAVHREKAKEHKSKMHEANRIAAEMIYLKNSTKHPHNTIDLHGLYVLEALKYLVKKLEHNSGEIEVITGRGLHSHNNIPKLKNAVISYLYQHNINFYLPPKNPGAVKVVLPENIHCIMRERILVC